MKIETAIILCAGYGKRLHPITLEVPKPLIKIKNKSLLLNTIELVANLGIKKIKLNTCLLYTSPSPRDQSGSRMPSSA